MSNPQGPPGYPTYPQRGYGGAPPRGSSGATVVTVLLAVVFVLATAGVAWGVHQKDTRSVSAPVVGSSGASAPSFSGGVPAAGGASSSGFPTSVSVPTPTISSYTPPPVPTPTHQPLDAEAVNRTFQVYMNALLYRSLSQLKSATCPKLRHTETGTALDGKYINRWQGHRYTIYNSLDYVIISATVRYVNPNTGGNGKTHVYSWYVDRYPDGHYWVCGIL